MYIIVNGSANDVHLRSYGGFAEGVHLFPYRTEKLSPSWPMVLHHNAGEQVAAIFFEKASSKDEVFFFYRFQPTISQQPPPNQPRPQGYQTHLNAHQPPNHEQ